MLSVGRGERCMRLWNLVTGKKAGVLNFSREILQSVREGKYSGGEGRRIQWSPDGSEFAVAFERGIVVFGEDSKPKCRIVPQPLTKLHQMSYVSLASKEGEEKALLAVSTEDGRILLYDPDRTLSYAKPETGNKDQAETPVPEATLVATVGGKATGITGRIKDFEFLFVRPGNAAENVAAVITASSDGTIRIIQIPISELADALDTKEDRVPQLGTVIGSYETNNRITCLKAFVMLPAREEYADGDEDFEGFDEKSEDSDSESDEE